MKQVLTVAEFALACRAGRAAALAVKYAGESELLRALALLGALEPLAASRPGVCDLVQRYRRTVEVPPATLDASGRVVNSRALAAKLCPSAETVIVVDLLELEPSNLTAELDGAVEVKTSPLTLFDKNCLPFGAKNEDCGAFFNIEHVILCAKTGLEIWAVNCNPCSPALFTLKGRLWETC